MPAQRLPFGTITLGTIILIASFMPWAVVHLRELPAGDVLVPTASMAEIVTAWNCALIPGGMMIPAWIVVMIAAAVVALSVLRAAEVWNTSQAIDLGLSLLGMGLVIAVMLTLGSTDHVGIGSVLTLMAFLGMTQMTLRTVYGVVKDRRSRRREVQTERTRARSLQLRGRTGPG